MDGILNDMIMKTTTEEPRHPGAAHDARQCRGKEMAGKAGQEAPARHSLLGASSSHRWLHCTPSAVAESRYEDTGSDFAREGSLAHAMAARELKTRLGRDTSEEEREIAELYEAFHTGEMDEYVDGYVAYVADRYARAREEAAAGGLMPDIRIEQHLDYSQFVPGGFGTGDTVIACEGTVEIIDLKYGKGVEVKAEENTQMMLYALGAMDLLDYAFDIRTVVMTIYQPRLGNVSTWSMPARELRRWAEEELRPLAMLAAKGKGVRSSGAWCRFCKAKGDCPRLAAESLDLWQLNADAESIRMEDMPMILERLGTVRDWVSAVEERALSRALAGEPIAGWKLVEGRSVRKITDPERAAALLAASGDGGEQDIYKPRELRTLTDLEKIWGKKRLGELLAEVIVKPQGKPALVPESDKRKPLAPGDEFDDLLCNETFSH